MIVQSNINQTLSKKWIYCNWPWFQPWHAAEVFHQQGKVGIQFGNWSFLAHFPLCLVLDILLNMALDNATWQIIHLWKHWFLWLILLRIKHSNHYIRIVPIWWFSDFKNSIKLVCSKTDFRHQQIGILMQKLT